MDTARSDVKSKIDSWLDWLGDYWVSIPQVADQIDMWDLERQLEFVQDDSPMAERLLDRLREASARMELTAEQSRRYSSVLRLAEERRSLVQHIQDGSSAKGSVRDAA